MRSQPRTMTESHNSISIFAICRFFPQVYQLIKMSSRKRVTRRKIAASIQELDDESVFSLKEKHEKYSRWSKEEHMLYVSFLVQNRESFVLIQGKKRKNLFTRMAKELACGRNNEQCRTHHEKMLKKFGNVENVIQQKMPNEKMKKKIQTKNQTEESPIPKLKQYEHSSSEKTESQVFIQIENECEKDEWEINLNDGIYQSSNHQEGKRNAFEPIVIEMEEFEEKPEELNISFEEERQFLNFGEGMILFTPDSRSPFLGKFQQDSCSYQF